MKNSYAFKEYVAPVLVLVAICLVVTAGLAVSYGVTNPIIIESERETADNNRQELLADADSFTEYDGALYVAEEGKVYVSECYVADNGAGIVVTVQTNSFGGALTAMVGVNSGGEVTGVTITSHSDTPGLGTKAMTDDYLSQYIGLTSLDSISAKEDSQVDYVSGASVSSNAIHYGVYCALQQFQQMGGVL